MPQVRAFALTETAKLWDDERIRVDQQSVWAFLRIAFEPEARRFGPGAGNALVGVNAAADPDAKFERTAADQAGDARNLPAVEYGAGEPVVAQFPAQLRQIIDVSSGEGVRAVKIQQPVIVYSGVVRIDETAVAGGDAERLRPGVGDAVTEPARVAAIDRHLQRVEV